AQLMELKQKQEEEARIRAHKNEQRSYFQLLFVFLSTLRVNNAFLDRLERKTQLNSICQPGYSGSLDYCSDGAWVSFLSREH
ncbi:UNVERIFIED_CONTAM: hypothetical protein H355_000977, partial [Colinus virginianus]